MLENIEFKLKKSQENPRVSDTEMKATMREV